MTEQIMSLDALQTFFAAKFRVKQVTVKEDKRGFLVEPVTEDVVVKMYHCPFLGTAKGGIITVDKFLEMKREEKELEDENEKRLFS
jgi:hypothetical protein